MGFTKKHRPCLIFPLGEDAWQPPFSGADRIGNGLTSGHGFPSFTHDIPLFPHVRKPHPSGQSLLANCFHTHYSRHHVLRHLAQLWQQRTGQRGWTRRNTLRWPLGKEGPNWFRTGSSRRFSTLATRNISEANRFSFPEKIKGTPSNYFPVFCWKTDRRITARTVFILPILN